MSCTEAVERMPWLVNATLAEDEERGLREHLSGCSACREELRRTRPLVAAFQVHPTAETLAAYGEGTLAERDELDRHLRACSTCADLAARAAESWRAYHEDEPPASRPEPPTPTPRRRPAFAALWAAGLVGLAASAGWLLTWRGWGQDRAAWQQREAALLRRVAAAPTVLPAVEPRPRLNVPVVELMAQDDLHSRRAGSSGTLNELRFTGGATEVTFVLLLGQRGTNSAGRHVEIVDAEGRPAWAADGLVPNADGDFTLTVPLELLPRERFTIVVHSPMPGSRPTRYDVRRPSGPSR